MTDAFGVFVAIWIVFLLGGGGIIVIRMLRPGAKLNFSQATTIQIIVAVAAVAGLFGAWRMVYLYR